MIVAPKGAITASVRPTAIGFAEPNMNLPGPGRVLVIGVHLSRSGTCAAADRSQHHQVVAEHSLRAVGVVVAHGVNDPGMVAGLHPFDPLLIGRSRLWSDDVYR